MGRSKLRRKHLIALQASATRVKHALHLGTQERDPFAVWRAPPRERCQHAENRLSLAELSLLIAKLKLSPV